MKFSSDVTTLVALFAIVSRITSTPVFLFLASGAKGRRRRVIGNYDHWRVRIANLLIKLILAAITGVLLLATAPFEAFWEPRG